MPPIGGAGGMDAIGAMLSRRQPPPASAQPPPGRSGGPPAQGTDADPLSMGAGADAQMQQIMAGMQRVRDIGEQVKQLAIEFPMAAPTAEQIQQLLKQVVVQMAPSAPTQTVSSTAVPGAGGPM